MVDDLLADRPKQQAGETAAAAVADHDEDCVARLIQEHVRRLAFARATFSLQRRLKPLRFCESVANDRLGALAEGVDRVLIRAGGKATRVHGRCDVPGGDDSQTNVAQCRLMGRGLECCAGAV